MGAGSGRLPARFASNLSATAEYGDVVGHPPVIRYTGARAAVGYWCAPEPDAIELVHAVGLAALVHQQCIVLACVRDRRHRAEPCREIALQLWTHGMLEPQVSAIGMRRLDVHHGGIRPSRGTFHWHDAPDRLGFRLEQIHLESPRRGRDHSFVLE